MTQHLTFKENLALLEARRRDIPYTEKEAKGAVDKVTATLSGTEAANMTKLARRFARLDASLNALKEQREVLNAKLKEDVQGMFDAEDVVLTRVVETSQFTLTLAKELKKTGPDTKTVDYESIIAALSALIDDELQPKVAKIIKKYTEVTPGKESVPVRKLIVSKEVVKEGIMDTIEKIKNWAAGLLKEMTSWATRYDSKLNNLKKKAGLTNG